MQEFLYVRIFNGKFIILVVLCSSKVTSYEAFRFLRTYFRNMQPCYIFSSALSTLTPEARSGVVATSLSVPFPVRFYARHNIPAAIFDPPNLRDNIIRDQQLKKYWNNLKIHSFYYPVIQGISTQIGRSRNVCADICIQMLVENFGQKSVPEDLVLI